MLAFLIAHIQNGYKLVTKTGASVDIGVCENGNILPIDSFLFIGQSRSKMVVTVKGRYNPEQY